MIVRFIFSLVFATTLFTVSCSTSETAVEDALKEHVQFLADDKLEGRETGTEGERLAMDYIAKEFEEAGILPAGQDGWLQPFEFFAKKEPSENSYVKFAGEAQDLKEECFPLAVSGSGTASGSEVRIVELRHNAANPHQSFDELIDVREEEQDASLDEYKALLIWSEDPLVEVPSKNWRRTVTEGNIPVFFSTKNPGTEVEINFEWEKDIRTGHNVLGQIANRANYTVVIGAHYDHLGWGEFGSLHTGDPEIHNGADDNASGVAGLIELAGMLSKGDYKSNNYLFIAFSGEELGLFGSKNYVRSDLFEQGGPVNYMLNMDMIGRLDSASGKLAIDGAKTSPAFDILSSMQVEGLDLKPGGSGIGSSDHMSFYLEDIPSLHFFTGTHADYHRPTDDEHLINYKGMASVIECMEKLIGELDDDGKIEFIQVKDNSEPVPEFKVTLGVIPDYLYEGRGMRIESVREERPAKLAGIQDGDVVLGMGELQVLDMMSYMKALGAFNKGETAKVEVSRDGKSLFFDVTF